MGDTLGIVSLDICAFYQKRFMQDFYRSASSGDERYLYIWRFFGLFRGQKPQYMAIILTSNYFVRLIFESNPLSTTL